MDADHSRPKAASPELVPESCAQSETVLIAEPKRNLWPMLRDWLWGYDFFVSYHWASGGVYAVNLAQMLRSKGFDVFLDRADYASGDDWKLMGRVALRNTQRLILIATHEAITKSEPVWHEVEVFTARSRQIIPIIFGDRFTDLDRKVYPILTRLPNTQLFIDSGIDSLPKGPALATVEELIRTHKVLQRRKVRAVVMLTVLLIISAFAIFATRMWRVASAAEKAALQDRTEAIHALTTNLEMFTSPTAIAGEIAAAVTNRDQDVVKDAIERLTHSDSLAANNGKIADSAELLRRTIADWKPQETPTWDKPKEPTSEAIHQAIIKFAGAIRSAWENQYPISRSAQFNRAKQLTREILVKPKYELTLTVTKAIADGSRERSDLDAFERLYWSELVFLETDEVESGMVRFRRKLLGDPDYSQMDLKSIASELKAACDEALSVKE